MECYGHHFRRIDGCFLSTKPFAVPNEPYTNADLPSTGRPVEKIPGAAEESPRARRLRMRGNDAPREAGRQNADPGSRARFPASVAKPLGAKARLLDTRLFVRKTGGGSGAPVFQTLCSAAARS